MNRDINLEEDFYREVANILETDYDYSPFRFKRPTRWNNRTPGNGRFVGFGIIRMFGPDFIQITLRKPISTSKTFYNVGEALNYLRSIK